MYIWQNNGKSISRQHLVDLYKRDKGKGTGLAIVPKLKYEHHYLTSFAKMRVDLAVQVSSYYMHDSLYMCIQVLCESVGKVLELTGGTDTEETACFVLMFDKFFDSLNVTKRTRTRKSFCHPYRHKGDQRLDVRKFFQ